MATIIKNTASNVSPTELSIARRTGAGSDTIYVVQGGLLGTIDGGGGSDHLVLDQTGAYTFNFNPGSSFASLIGIEIVSLGTKGTAGPLTTGSTTHSINASAYTNGLTINGNNGANSITGTAFNDIISGGGGTDTLNGGEGSDTYLYTTLADFDAEKGAGLNDLGTGDTDTVSISATSGTFTLAAFANGIEAYTITGTTGTAGINASAALSGLVLTGGGGANAITGTNFADTISGGGGADNLIGGGGDDTFVYALSTDFVAGEKIDGGAGTSDTILISAPSGLITLSNVVIGVEYVTLTGSGTAGVNAAAVLNGLTITGNGGADTITGTNSADTINGGLGNDTITGGGGTDVLNGGEGSDTYIYSQTADFVDNLTDGGSSGTDTVSITATTGTLTLTAALNGIEAYTIAGAGAVSIVASAVTTGLTLTGSTGINTLTGTAQADIITGGGGKDILNGGGGDDTFDYALTADYASESIDGGLGTDTIRFSGTTGTLVLGNTLTSVEQVLLAGSSNIGVDAKAVTTNGLAITGNAGNNTITGTNNADSIDGGAGNDTITGGTGADTLLGGLGNDTFIVTLGSEHGSGEVINGQEGTDAIAFVGGTATASLTDRTLTLTAGDDVENIFMAAATGAAAPTGTVALNVDASAMTTTGHGVNITGNNGANILTGSAFADTLSGGAGNDTLSGGDGDDAFLYASQAEYGTVTPSTFSGDAINGGTGTDTLRYTATAAGTFTLANNLTGVEAVALSNAAGSLTGTVALGVDASLVTSALAIYGNAGNNAIRGGTAADTLDGGAGNDIFLIKDAAHHGLGEVIIGGAGTADEIRFDSATIDSTLVLRSGVDASVERAVIGTGTAAAAVTTATTALNIDASAVANAITLIGNNGANVLVGGAGNDTLDGGVGNDLLDGGEGSDTYLYGATTNYGIEESISDFGTSGTDTIQISAASGSLVLRDDTTGIEQVVITGAAAGVDASAVLNALTITGGSGANAIKGTAFADVFTGGAGADNMSGNGGNDVFILNTAAEGTGDVITGGDGYDTVRFLGTGATATTNTLVVAASTNVEEIEISDAAGLNTGTAALNINAAAVTASGIKFTGNAGVNTITGGSGADIIEGGFGNDILNGGGGNDAILVGKGTDHVTGEKIDGGAGTADTVRFTSTTATDTLTLLANTVGIERVDISDAAGDTSGTTALNVNAAAVTVALTITGNDGANTITGTNAADTINAGGGDDIIIVSTAASHGAAEVIDGGAGTDTLRYTSTTAGETLTTTGLSNMENIVIGTAGGVTTGTTALNVDASNSNSALSITGNDGVNTLTGSSFADTLAGNAGADVLNGGGGNDTLDGGTDSDIMNGAEGDDSFRDINIGDQIYGGAGNDALSASTAMPDFNLTDLDIGGATTVNLVERIDLKAAGANVLLTFVAADIEAIVGAGGTLVIDADGGDELFSVEDWGNGTIEGDYTRYSNSGVSILVSSDVGFGKTFTGTTGTDNFVGSNSPDTFLFTYLTLNNDDTLDGGVNTAPPDRIIITGGNLVNFLASTATITGIEVIQIGDNLDTQLVLRNGAIEVSTVTGFGNGNNTITLGDGTAAQDVTTGSGNDTININILGGADESMFTLAAGGGNDTLAISGGGSLDMTDFTGVSGFESVTIDGNATTFTANNDALAITAGNGGNAITLGSGTQSVTSGSGADSVALGSGTNIVNTGDGSDTVTGGVAGSDAIDLQGGDDTYTLDASSTGGTVSGGTGGSDTLAIGVGVTATILLGEVANATINGVGYSNFDNLSATGANGALTVTAAAGGSTITTGTAGDNVTAGGNSVRADNINTGAGTDTVNITSGTYSGDTLNGGADSDTLAITGGGAVNMNSATISGFETVTIDGMATTFTANNDALAITAGNGGNTITLGTGTQSVTAGTGADTVNLGSGNNNVNTGGGADTVNGTVAVGDQVDLDAGNDSFAYQTLAGDVRGGSGTDTITIASGAGSVSLNLNVAAGNGNYSGFENISAAGANGAITATAVTGGSTIDTGSAADNVTAGAGTDLINTGAGNDTINITSGTYSGDTLNGGADSTGDTLAITGGGTVDLSTGVTVSGIENISIDDTATTFTANNDDLAISAGNGGNTITLGTGLQSVSAGSGADIVNLGSGTNNVNTGGGADTVNGTLGAADIVDLGADNDSFAYQTLAGDVRGGAGSDTITYSGSTAITLDLTATQAATHYSGFENITATGTGAITATASVDGGAINTASGDDIVTLNVGVDTANLGSGNDTITSIGAGDQITLGDGSDTATYAAAAGALVDAGESVETAGGDILNLTSAGPLTINLAASGSNQITGGSGDWRNFENLSAGASSGALTVTADTVGSVITTGSGNDNVTAGGNSVRADNINTGAGTDTVNITSATYAGDTLDGDAGTDTLAITGGGAVNMNSAIISGFETVTIDGTSTTFTANNDNLAISAGNGGNTITLGTGTQSVTAGTGADTVNLGAGNNNVNTGGGADTVNGTVAVGDQVDLDAGNDSFAYQTLAGDVRGGAGTDTITIASGAGSVSLNLNVAAGNGNYSGFENISAAGANGAITATAVTGGSTIDTGSAADNVTAGAGTDLINTGAGNDTINITSGTYSGDTLNGGADSTGDTLAITGGGTVDLSTGVTVSNIENVTIDNSAVSANVFTAHDAALTITVSGGNVGATITLGDTLAQTLTITGTGNDTVTLGTGINNVNTGDGSDTVNGTLDATDTVDLDAGNDSFAYQTLVGDVRGGAGTDTITYNGAGPISIDLSASAAAGFYSGFENVSVTGTGAVTIIASSGGSTITTGSGIDVLTTGIGIDNFDTGAGNDTINITSTTYASDTLNGGADTDTLSISGGGIVNISTGVTVTNFENVLIADNTSTTFTANNLNLAISTGDGDNTITLGSGTQSVTSGAGADTVALGGGANVVNTGGGSDSVTGTVGTGDTIDLGTGNDSYAFQTLVLGSSVSGGTDSDTLIYSGSADQVIDFLTITDNIAAEAGTYSNFENLNATTSVGFLNVTAAAAGGTINTGTGNDTITLGAGIDLVNTGAGADTVLGAVGAGDTINLAGADDIFAYQVLVTGATVDGGTSADTLTYSGSDAKTINFTNTTDNITAEDGVYLRFESLLAAGASGNLTVTAATTGSTIITGSGNDDITMGAGTDSISTGAGVDVVSGTLSAGEAINLGGDNDNYGYQVTFDAANVIDADAGTGDNLTYNGAANLTINFSNTTDNIGAEAGFYRNFENLLAATATGSYIVTAATTGSTINTGSGSDTITLGAGVDTVDAGGNSDTVNNIGALDIVSLGDDADTAVYSAVAATVSGGTGGTDSDTLQINATTGVMTINLSLEPAIQQVTVGGTGTWTDFENLSAAGATHALTVIANTGGSVITTGSDNDVVTLALNNNADIVTLGDGSDTINNIGNNDTINLGDGDDTATYTEAVSATIDGGENGETNGDTLILTTTGPMTLDLSLVGSNQVTAGGVASSWRNFENLSAGGSTHALTVTADSVGSAITTGSGNDSVTAGASTVRADNIATGNGDDTVNITSTTYSGDTLNGGGNTGAGDTLAITGGNTVNMNSASISNFEKVTINNTATTFIANNDALAITAGDGGNTITLGTGIQSVTSGLGNDTITLGASTQSVTTAGAGDDIIVANDALLNGAAMTLNGGANTAAGDTLRVTDNASLDDGDFANMSGIENLVLQGTNNNNIGTVTPLGTAAEAAGIVSIDATAATGIGSLIIATGYLTAGLTVTTGGGADTVQTGAGNDTITTGSGDDDLQGGAGSDTLNAGADNDALYGASGIDALTGGAGDDRYSFFTGDVGSGESITEAGGGGSDQILLLTSTDFSNMTAASFDEIEQIVITAGETATFAGDQLHNEVIGINESAAGTTNVVINVNDAGSSTQNFSLLTFAGFSHVITGATDGFDDGADTVTINTTGASVGQSIIGTTIADTINGTGFNDILEGHGGTDVLLGGAGDDVYVVGDSAHHGAAEIADTAGTADEVRFTSTTGGQTLTLAAGDTGLEKVTIGTSAGVTTGTTALNVNASAVVNALTITGNDGANALVGTGLNDTIIGGAGDDTITGGVGSDNLSGGDGGDTFVVGAVADFTFLETVNGGANASGVDTLRLDQAGTYGNTVLDGDLSGIEVVSLNQDAAGWNLSFADAAYANADANGDGTADGTITVSAATALTNGIIVVAGTGTSTNELVVVGTNLGGNDTITAGVGADNIDTGAGDDRVNILSTTYANDTLTGGANTDTLAITGGGTVNMTLATISGFENVSIDNSVAGNVFTANNDDLTITATSGNENVSITLGTGAQDVTISGTGDDTVVLGSGTNVVVTGGGSDTVSGIGTGDNVSLGADEDTAVFSAVTGATIGGGEGGTDSDTLQIDTTAADMTIDLDVTGGQQVTGAASTWQDFENLAAGAVGVTHNLTVNANAAGSTIVTGSGADNITLGAGTDIVNAGAGADVVTGTVGAADEIYLEAGTDTYTYQALTTGTVDGGTGSDTLVVGAGAGPLTITLGDIGNTVTGYSNFDNLTAGSADGILTVTAATGGSTITTGIANDDVTAGAAADSISTGTGDDTVRITGTTYANDTLTGGGNTGTGDTLAITGGGTVNMTLATISGFENVTISNSTAGTNTFTANSDSLAITVSGGNENATINLGATGTQSVTISGSGNDNVALGSGVNVVNTGDGADTVTGAVQAGDAIDLGAGNDTYDFDATSTGGTVSGGAGGSDTLTIGAAGNTAVTITLGDGANATIEAGETAYSNFDNLAAGASDDALVVTAAAAGSSIATGSAGDTVNLGAGTDIVSTGDGSDTVNGTVGGTDTVDLGAGADSFTYQTLTTGTVTGGTGIDTLAIGSGFGPLTITLGDIGNTVTGYSFFDNLSAATADGILTVTAAVGGSTITTGTAADIITLGAGIDTVNSGNGADTVTNIGAGDTVNLEGGDDSASFLAGIAATINGGETGETLGDTLTITGTTEVMTINLSAGGQQITVGNSGGTYQNFENLIASGATHALTVTADSVGSTITTGSAADSVTLGIGTDTVSTGDSVDTISGGLSAGDSINFGGGDESYTYETTVATVNGGEGNETNGDALTITSTTGAMTINLNAVDAQQITVGSPGTWMNFEDLLAGGATHSLNVTASSDGSTITTGSANDQIVLGAGVDIVDAGDGNDGVSGILTTGDQVTLGAGDDNFTYSALVALTSLDGDIGSDTLVYNLDNANALFIFNVDLTNTNHIITDDAGDYQNFENFNSQTSNDIIHLISNAGAGVVTGSGADVITLAVGGESINTFTGNDTFHGTAATINDADNINGGGGVLDTLNITGGGTVNLATATVTNIEVINTDATLATNLTLNTMSVTVTMGTDNDILVLGVAGGTATVVTGDGDDTVTLGGGQNFITTGNGSDTILGSLTSGDTIDLGGDDDTYAYSATIDSSNEIDGSTGNDTLTYGGGSALTIDFSVNTFEVGNIAADAGYYYNFENLSAAGASGVLTVTAATTGSVITTGTVGDTVYLGAGTDIVSTGGGSDTVTGALGGADVVDLQGDNDTFDYLDSLAGDVRGGDQSDTLTIDAANNAVALDLNASAGFGVYSGFENIDGATADNIITVTASTNGGTINTGSANDVVTLNTGTDTVNTGAGSDTVNGAVQLGDLVDLDADNDIFAYRAILGDVRGGAGIDTITVAPGEGTISIDLSHAAGAGFYSGFENISGGGADGSITATAATTGGTITTGSAADTVNLGAGTDIVSTGDGADTVNGTLGGADVVNLEGDDDTFGYQDALAGDVRGGLGSDILLIEAADGVVSLNLNAAAGVGAYSGFENISGATADDSITVTASTSGGSITTGSAIDNITLNTGTDIVSTGNGADVVTGTLDATDVVDLQGDNDSFDYQVLVGDVRGGSGSDSLVIDAADGAVTLDLNDTFGAGNYSDFENIAGGTADDIITVIASTNGGGITTGSAADDITLNTGTDVVLAGTGNDIINATAGTLNATDNIDGEGGATDTLAITGGGTVRMDLATVTNIEFVTLADSVTFVANNTVSLTITGSADADTITTGNVAQTVNAGEGADSVTLGAASQSINGQGGDDTINVNATTIASTIAAGETNETLGDTLNVTGGGAVVMGAGVTEFEKVTLAVATAFTANDTGLLVITGSSGPDTIVTGNAVQTVNAGADTDTITLGASGQTINGEGGSDTVRVNGTTIASTIDGGVGDTDVLEVLVGSGAVVMGAAVTNFEEVELNTGITSFTANDTASLVINGSTDGEAIITGNAVQTVHAGAGTDTITLGAAGQTINGQADSDTVNVNATTIASTIDAGAGDTDVLNVTGGGTVVMGGSVTNFEQVTLAIGTNFTANTTANLLITGSAFADTITVGATSQVVDAGAGNDVIVFTDTQFDFGMDINGEADTDTVRISDRASVADSAFTQAVSVETLELAYTAGLSQSVVLGAAAEAAGVVTVNASAATGNVTVSDGTGTGALSITTGTGNDTINLGTAGSSVVASTGNDTVNVDATTIASTIDGGVGDTDDLRVASGGTAVMGVGVTNFETVTLLAGTTFTANDTANLTINGSATADVITTGNAVQTVNAGVGSDIITLGAAGQTINGGDGDDLVNVNATTIASTIAAGEADETTGDTLNVTGGGTVVMGAAVTEFENVTLAVATTFTANNTVGLIINGSTGADTITTGNVAQTVNGGTGNDTITLGAAGQTINGEDGDDTVNVNATTIASTIAAGEGAESGGDTLNVTGGGTVTMGVGVTEFEKVTLAVATVFTANTEANLAITGSTGNDNITVGADTQSVAAGDGSDVIRVTDLQFDTNMTLDGGAESNDMIIFLSDASTVDGDFANVSNIEILQLAGGAQSVTLAAAAMAAGLTTFNAQPTSGVVTVDATAFANTLSIDTGAGNDVITLGGGTNVVSTGAGSDTVNGALSTGDTIDLGADNDIFDYRVTAASNFVDGGAGTADEITYSGGAKSFDFSLLLNNVTGELGSYRNFENLDAVGATGAITAIAATTGSSIDTASVGAHNDVITLGAGTDIVNTFDGDDTVNATGTSLAGDTIDAGAGITDTLAITGGGTVVMGAAVTNFEFVTLATATIFTANDTVGLTITGSGSGTDIITTGAAAQTVNAGSGNDIIIVGAVGQTIDAGNGNDTVVLSVAEAVGATSITGGNNSDTLEFSGGGIVNIGALGTITSFENISTGTTMLDLTLTNTGFLVNVQGGGGVDHDITSGDNSGGDDTFKFDASNWAGSAVIIDNFVEGPLNDVLDLSLLGIQTFWGEVATAGALVDSAFTGGGIEAVFAQDTDTLYVDFNGDGSFNGATDLQILMTGVNNLTEATDLLI